MFKINPSSIAAQKVNIEGATYRLVNEETGQEYTIHIGPFADVDQFRGVTVTLPLPAKTGTTTYTIEVKVNSSELEAVKELKESMLSLVDSPYKPKLQEAATTPNQEPATYKFRHLQEASHATK